MSQLREVYDKWMYCPDYEATAHEILFVAEEKPRPRDQSTWIKVMVGDIYRRISGSEVSEEDLVGLSLTAWRTETESSVVVIPMRRKKQMIEADDLLKAFTAITGDSCDFLTSRPLVVKVKHVKQNNDQRAADVFQFHKRCLGKKSILTVGASESPVESLARALSLGEAYIPMGRSEEFERLKMQKETRLKERAGELLQAVGQATGEEVDVGMRAFDNYYTEKFTITVFLGFNGRQILYESWAPPNDDRKQIDIITDGREFHFVQSLENALSFDLQWKYCRLCRLRYPSEPEHECLKCCRHCRKIGLCYTPLNRSTITCNDCRRDFLSDSCYSRHRQRDTENKSTCETLKMCKECLLWYSNESRHETPCCRHRFCENCREMRPAIHTCHASRQTSQVGTPSESRDNGRSLTGYADNLLEVAGTSAIGISRPTGRRSRPASAPAHQPAVSPSPGSGTGRRRDTCADPTGRSPATSTAAHQPDISSLPGTGTVSRRNTSAGPPHLQAPPAADNRPREGVQVRVARQGAEAAGVEPDLPSEGGAVAPVPVQGLYYPHNRKVEFTLSPQ